MRLPSIFVLSLLALFVSTPSARAEPPSKAAATSEPAVAPATAPAASRPAASRPAVSRPASRPAASRPAPLRAVVSSRAAKARIGKALGKPRPFGKRRPRRMHGTLAVVNLGRRGLAGWEVAERVRQAFTAWAGGWARQPGVADNLVGKPQPAVLPSNVAGLDLWQNLEWLRTRGRPTTSRLWQLGRTLGVDYLLLLEVRKRALSARLFSVNRQRWAPQGFERAGHDIAALRAFVVAQVNRPVKRASKKSSWRKKWWVWVAAGALAALTIGFALSESTSSSGTLRVKVSR